MNHASAFARSLLATLAIAVLTASSTLAQTPECPCGFSGGVPNLTQGGCFLVSVDITDAKTAGECKFNTGTSKCENSTVFPCSVSYKVTITPKDTTPANCDCESATASTSITTLQGTTQVAYSSSGLEIETGKPTTESQGLSPSCGFSQKYEGSVWVLCTQQGFEDPIPTPDAKWDLTFVCGACPVTVGE